MAIRRKKKAPKPFWERAYHGHALWQGKQKIGKVTLTGHGGYLWEAAGRSGRTDTLRKARAAVELAVVMSDRQLPLFTD